MPSCVDYKYVAQEISTGKLYVKTENNEIMTTFDLDKAHIFDLIDGSRFLADNPKRFVLKTTIRVEREMRNGRI